MSFTPRLTAPSQDNPYYYSNLNRYYANGMGMPNCTAYSYGRAYELLESEPTLYYGNAENWYPGTTTYPKGSEPALGAIMCWGEGSSGNGHTANVEEIIGNGIVLVSESAYNQWVFRTHTYTYPYNFGLYIFQGFIYILGDVPSGGNSRSRFNFLLFNRRKRLYGQ